MSETTCSSGLLGILGGMGPLAGAAFASRLVALTPAERDQDHVPALLCNDPRVPDRSSARLGHGEDPLKAMMAGLRLLEAAGASLIAIPCNTAHLWYEQMADRARVPLLHIVEAVCEDLERYGVRGSVGLMGTPATLKLGLYQQPLRQRGFEVITPDAAGVAQCVEAIAAVKGNRPGEAFQPAAQCIRGLLARGASAVVLGCTELPLAVPHEQRSEFPARANRLDRCPSKSGDRTLRARGAPIRRAPCCMRCALHRVGRASRSGRPQSA